MSSSAVRLTTVCGWNFRCLGYEVDDDGIVTEIYCKTCQTFFMGEDGNIRHNNLTASSGSAKEMNDKYIKGTNMIKKINFANHVAKNKDHEKAARLLKERDILSSNVGTLEATGICSGLFIST